jgi:hypothetical protein
MSAVPFPPGRSARIAVDGQKQPVARKQRARLVEDQPIRPDRHVVDQVRGLVHQLEKGKGRNTVPSKEKLPEVTGG